MAQIASIFLSNAKSSPSSQVAQPYQPGAVESDFPAMLSQASFSVNPASGANTKGAPASGGTNRFNGGSATNLFSCKIRNLLKNGVSIDRISNAIATKIVALVDGKGGSGGAQSTSARIAAVAAYLKQGESDAQDAGTTANDLADKVVTLLSALKQQNVSTGANGACGADSASPSTDCGKILDALKAGDPSTARANAKAPSQASTQAAPAPGTLQSALMALLSPGWQGAAASSAPSIASSLLRSTEPLAQLGSEKPAPTLPSTPSTASTLSASSTAADATAATATQISLAPASAASALPSDTGVAQAQAPVPRVATGLEAIASSEGTALERALIRAAGASVAREATQALSPSDSNLAAISASLDQLLAASTTSAADGSIAPRGAVVAGPAPMTDPAPGPTVAFGLADPTAQRSAGPSSPSAPAGTQSYAPLDEIMDQVVTGLSMKNFHDNPTVSIALNPPDLGRLSVKISVADSNVTASVVAPSSEVQNAVLAHRSQLDQLFASAGLKLGSLNVDVSGQGLDEEAASRQTHRERLLAVSARAAGLIKDPTAGDSFKQGSGPSMLGGVNLTLLNQLV